MKRVLFTLLLLFVAIQANSQVLPGYLKAGTEFELPDDAYICKKQFHDHKKSSDEILEGSAIVYRPYDVLEYKLFLDWYKPLSADVVKIPDSVLNDDGQWEFDTIYVIDREWDGLQNIKIKIDSADVSEIVFDAKNLLINSVSVDGKEVLPVPKSLGGEVIINTGKIYNSGEIVNIEIDYTFTDQNSYSEGFWLFAEGDFIGFGPEYESNGELTRDSVFVEERLAYTMSEPQNARQWMPCNDAPHDKALSSISIKVPKGFNTASNGLLTETEENEVFVIYRWKNESPITTYLMVANASKFKVYSEWYKKVTNPLDSIEIQYYVWEDDYNNTATDGSKYNARHAFRNTLGMMESYARSFGEYPFEKYGMVSAQPFNYGGMEHQTMTTVNRYWLRGTAEGGIAHELAHQWIGDLITCATWNDIWINEGGATWSEALWAEGWGGKEVYYNTMLGKRWGYLRQKSLYDSPTYGVPVEYIFWTHTPIVYNKASWVYHMLREMLGDEKFFFSLRNLFERYGHASLETEDFKNSFMLDAPDSPVDLNTFFDQWVYKSGHPIFSATGRPANASDHNFYIELDQIQSGIYMPEYFVTPVTFVFLSGEQKYIDTVMNYSRRQVFHFDLPFMPDSFYIDENRVLCQVASSVLSVKELNEGMVSEGFVYPNPLTRGQLGKCSLNLSSDGNLNVSVYDIMGRKVKEVWSGYLKEGNYECEFSTNELNPGAYFIKTQSGVETKSFKFTLGN